MLAELENDTPVELLSDAELDNWLSGYTAEEIAEIEALWHKYAGARYRDLITAEAESA